jgi:Holliday junction resolvasome RuvABC endonuclease subunit
MAQLLAVDPGLDRTGWATFDLDGVERPLIYPDAGKRFRDWGTWDTPSHHPLDQRFDYLLDCFRRMVIGRGITHVAIEAPARPGFYARNTKFGAAAMAQGIAYANMMPTLFYGASFALSRITWLIPPHTKSKVDRWNAVYPFLSIEGRANADARDAIVVGMSVLTDSRRRWR